MKITKRQAETVWAAMRNDKQFDAMYRFWLGGLTPEQLKDPQVGAQFLRALADAGDPPGDQPEF